MRTPLQACRSWTSRDRYYHKSSAQEAYYRLHEVATGGNTRPGSRAPSTLNPNRDEGIMSRTVRVVDPINDSPKEQSLAGTLATMNRKKNFLIRVSGPDDAQPPICKIVPKRDVFEEERDRQIAAHNADHTRKGNKKLKRSQGEAAKTKIIEVGWGIGQADLERRVQRLFEFLEKGLKVEIALQNKKRGSTVATVDAEKVLSRLKAGVTQAAGRVAREEGAVGGLVKMLIEPPLQK
ncbi:MAG: hypothetical protein MMC23_009380 [Stictis urceolatum]|nr:hypothetical protein [Stictis urceolata]